MKKFIFLLLLIPSLCWGASTTLSGTGSTTLSATGSTSFLYYDTLVFSSFWDGTDALDTGGTGTGVPWSAESDSTSVGDLSSGKYVVTAITNGSRAYVYKTITSTSELEMVFNYAPSTTSVSLATSFNLSEIAGGAAVSIKASNNSYYDVIRVAYQDGSGTWQTISANYITSTSMQTVTVDFGFSSDTSTSDGYVKLYVDGVLYINSKINTYNRSATDCRAGVTYASSDLGAGNSISFDNFYIYIKE